MENKSSRSMNRLEMLEIVEAIDEITGVAAGFAPAQIILTANRLDLFTRLADGERSAQALAATLGTDPRATAMLCDALAAMELLIKKEDTYANSPKAARFLVRGQPYYIGDSLRHQAGLWARWGRLEEAVKTGAPVNRDEHQESSEQKTREFTLAMANIGRLSAGQLVDGLDLHGVCTLIDVGGGPGIYAVECVRKQPDIRATVFDLPEVVSIAEEYIDTAALRDRVTTRAGDAMADDLGGPYDLALMSNFIHIFSLEQIHHIIKKVADALNPDGRLVVKDFFVNEARTGPRFAMQFAMNMLLHTEAGNTYSVSEIEEAFREAGLVWLYSYPVGRHSTVAVAGKRA